MKRNFPGLVYVAWSSVSRCVKKGLLAVDSIRDTFCRFLSMALVLWCVAAFEETKKCFQWERRG